MAMLNWVRVARMKAEAEKVRAAKQALDDPDHRRDDRDRRDPAPAGSPGVAPQAQSGTRAVPSAPKVPRGRGLLDPEERTDGLRSRGTARREVDSATPGGQEARAAAVPAAAASQKPDAIIPIIDLDPRPFHETHFPILIGIKKPSGLGILKMMNRLSRVIQIARNLNGVGL